MARAADTRYLWVGEDRTPPIATFRSPMKHTKENLASILESGLFTTTLVTAGYKFKSPHSTVGVVHLGKHGGMMITVSHI